MVKNNILKESNSQNLHKKKKHTERKEYKTHTGDKETNI